MWGRPDRYSAGLGSSALFADACFMLEFFRDADVLIQRYLTLGFLYEADKPVSMGEILQQCLKTSETPWLAGPKRGTAKRVSLDIEGNWGLTFRAGDLANSYDFTLGILFSSFVLTPIDDLFPSGFSERWFDGLFLKEETYVYDDEVLSP